MRPFYTFFPSGAQNFKQKTVPLFCSLRSEFVKGEDFSCSWKSVIQIFTSEFFVVYDTFKVLFTFSHILKNKYLSSNLENFAFDTSEVWLPSA